jgi:hypothetical protein
MEKIPNRELNDIANFLDRNFANVEDASNLPILAVSKLFKEMALKSAEQRKAETEVDEPDMLIIDCVRNMLSYKVTHARREIHTKMVKEFLQAKRDIAKRSLPIIYYI